MGQTDRWMGDWMDTKMKGRGAAVSVGFRPESTYKLNKSHRACNRCLSACVEL